MRFRALGWWAIGVLLLTGLLNPRLRGWWIDTGHALAWKLGLVAFMLVVSAVHDFVIGPRAGRAAPGSPEAMTLRRRAAWAARINALAAVGLVVAAVQLARGG